MMRFTSSIVTGRNSDRILDGNYCSSSDASDSGIDDALESIPFRIVSTLLTKNSLNF